MKIDQETWKRVQEFKNYEVSNKGRVRNTVTGNIINCSPSHIYFRVSFCSGGKTFYRYVHRLVAKAFIPNPQKLPCVNHIDLNKRNNESMNLEWCSYAQNRRHAVDNGVKYGSPSLDRKIQIKIKDSYSNGMSMHKLAKKLNLSVSTIHKYIYSN